MKKKQKRSNRVERRWIKDYALNFTERDCLNSKTIALFCVCSTTIGKKACMDFSRRFKPFKLAKVWTGTSVFQTDIFTAHHIFQHPFK